MNYRDKLEIKISDLVHYLLLKWRSFVVCVLIGMLGLGIFGYYRKVPVMIDEKGEVSPAGANSLVSLENKLTTYEKNEVVLAVEAYLGYEKNYNDRLKLLEKSITLNYDAYSIPVYVIDYKIKDYSQENVPLQSTITNVDNIVALYKDALYDASVISEIKNINDWDYDDAFIRETYGVTKTGLDVMTVTINAFTKEECEKTSSILNGKISEAFAGVRAKYEHNLDVIQTVNYSTNNATILDQQKTQNDALVNTEKAMQQISTSMTTDQKAYYTALLKAVKEEMSDSDVDMNTMPIVREKASLENTLSGPDGEADNSEDSDVTAKTIDSAQSVVYVSSKTISIKYLFIGFLAGIFMAFFVHGFIYILSSRLRSKTEMADLFDVSILGNLRDGSRYNRLFGSIDKFIDSIFDKNTVSLSDAEQMDMMTSAICLDFQKNEQKRLYITGAASGEFAQKIKDQLIGEIGNNPLNDGTFIPDKGGSPLISTDSLRKLTSSDAVVLVEQIGESRYEDISKIIELCEKYGVKLLGSIVVC